jgi:threonine dehydrogenase-like Zn-dependent dehydrogenase
VTHRLPFDDALTAYANFQAKHDQTIKVVLQQ